MTLSMSYNDVEERLRTPKYRGRRHHKSKRISFDKKTEWDIELQNCRHIRKIKITIRMTQIPAFSPSQISSQTSHNVPESVASAAKTSISTKSEQAVKYLKANPMKLRHRISKKFNLP